MEDRFMNTYIYTTRDVVEALKNNGITKNTMQISQYIRDNKLNDRGMAVKKVEQIPGLNETHEVWRLSIYGTNEIIKYFLDKRRQEENQKKYVYKVKQLVKKYGKDYARCNGPAISIFMNDNKYIERKLAIKNEKREWRISQEGVNEMFLKLFKRKPEEEKGFIYGTDDIIGELRKTRIVKDYSEIITYLEQLECEGLAQKVPTSQGVYNPQKAGMYKWRISEEGLERIKNKLPVRENKLNREEYKQITLPDKELAKIVTINNEGSPYIISVEIEKTLFNYLLILENVTGKTKEQICTEIVEKQIKKNQEEISKILNA